MTVRILRGDVRQVTKTLPDNSVHCCVTSPPYWGLRSYLPDNHPEKHLEIGSEPTLQEWVSTMVDVFREVRRVLRPDGTLWLNLGDAYNAGTTAPSGASKTADVGGWTTRSGTAAGARRVAAGGLKVKDLMGQPWRIAFALQADGWWLRQEIIWHKPNPMPESTRDRCTKAHEHVFLLSKSERYFYDFDAMQEPVSGGAHARRASNGVGFGHGFDEKVKPRYKTPDGWDTRTGAGGHGSFHAEGREKGRVLGEGVGHRQAPPGNPAPTPKAAQGADGTKNNASFDKAMAGMPDTRNPRSVWTIPTHPFKGAHFATFPPALAAKCVTAGCPVGGTVLDIFGGSGTVGLVAERQHKHAILIDLDERNVPMATERITAESPLFAEVEA